MSDFVEQCRQEWKRLGVPDPLAEEMAVDLATDLREAEADGLSTEEFLGSSAFDPRSFAASWAAGRGIIPAPPGQGDTSGGRRKPRILVAFTALAAITVIVAALLLLTGEPTVALKTTRLHVGAAPPGFSLPSGPSRQVVHTANISAPVELILLFLAIVALGFAAWLWSNWSRTRPPTATA